MANKKNNRRRRKRRNPRSREPGFKQTDKTVHKVNIDDIPKWKMFYERHKLALLQGGLIAVVVAAVAGLLLFFVF